MGVIWEPRPDAAAAGWRERAWAATAAQPAPRTAMIERGQFYAHEPVPVLFESGLRGKFLCVEQGGGGPSQATLAAEAEAPAKVA